jgi:hypothetical protein
VRTTPDGGIAVAPASDAPVSVKSLVSTPPEGESTTPATAVPNGKCAENMVIYQEWLAATIKGDRPGSRVNVRPRPSLDTTSGSYGLVGESIAVMGEATKENCDRWYQVQFPDSGHQGWVFSDFVAINP